MEGTGEAIEKIGWGSSYRCSSGISYQLEGTMMGSARITFQYIHVQVFNFTTPGNFSSGVSCKDCWHSNIVSCRIRVWWVRQWQRCSNYWCQCRRGFIVGFACLIFSVYYLPYCVSSSSSWIHYSVEQPVTFYICSFGFSFNINMFYFKFKKYTPINFF